MVASSNLVRGTKILWPIDEIGKHAGRLKVEYDNSIEQLYIEGANPE